MAETRVDGLTHPAEKSSSTLLSRRLNKILETRLENDKDTLEALKELSTFFTENNLRTRRNLRGQIERRSLTINQDFLSAFREVKEALDSIYSDVINMNSMCQEIGSELQATKTQTHHLIEQTNKLQAESQKLSMQQEVAGAFLRSFQLTPNELATLRGSRNHPITLDFFKSLERVQTIHRDCRVLLQSGHQGAALEIMEQMALFQEAALERLYRWTQSQCRNVESPEINILLTQALSCLQDRPVLFKYVLDEYCTSRRSVLVRAFIDALTVGGHGGTPRPIELHAHDPQRYVGDMLAWLHQAVPGEKENLQVLLKGCDKIDVCEQCQQLLANITEGVCRPLKVRVEQIIVSEPGAVTLYRLTNLLRFYQHTIGQVVPDSILLSTLAELQQLSYKMFISALQGVVTKLTERVEPPGGDLAPSVGVTLLLNLMKDVLSGGSVVEDRQQDLKQIVSCIVDPLLMAVNESASQLTTTDMAVYLLNCLYHLHSTLLLYEFTDSRLEMMQCQMDAHIDTLTSEQASSMVAHLGLSAIYTILQDNLQEPLSTVPGMDPASLRTFLGKLDSFLSAPDVLLLPQTRLLLSSAHRRTVQKRSLEVISAIYKQLYEAVQKPSNGYQNPCALVQRTPEQVQNLLL